MAIRIPTTDQSKIFLGSQEIGAVYVGANKVWPDAPLIDPNAFIMRISVSAGQTITIPFYNTTGYNGVIDWKDGTTSTITTYNDADRVHTYAAAGDYDIEFTGTFKGFYFNNTGSKLIVKKIIQWGSIGITSTVNAFYGCTNLIDLGDIENCNLISLGNSCFQNCTGLTSVTIPNSVTSLGSYCFSGCTGLTSLTIPSSVTSLGDYCLYYCTGLTSVTIPSSVTSFPQYCFSGCTSLTSVTIPNSVTSFGVACFVSSGLTAITIPSSVTSLGSSCFQSCTGLTSLTIPSSVTSLSSNLCYMCSSLISVTIPISVTSIGNNCFRYCSSALEYFVNPTTPPTLGSSAFSGKGGLWKIKVPASSVTAYKAATVWSSYAYYIVSQ